MKPSPVQPFVMNSDDFPGVGAHGPVTPSRSDARPGAWATRPILPIVTDASDLDISGPIERANAQSPVSPSPPPAHHLVPASPSPSELDANELAAELDMMDVGTDASVDAVRPVALRADAEPYEGNTEPYGVDTDALMQELAYYRAAAEHWQGLCLQMQAHVAMVCGPLPGLPTV